MTKQLLIILFLATLLSSFGQTKCSCEAIIDINYKGDISIYKTPLAAEAKKLRQNLKDEDLLILTILKDSSDFFFADISYSIDENNSHRGWIKKSKTIGTYARNYSRGDTLRLFSKPDIKGKVQNVVPEYLPDLYTIEKCSGKWAFVSINFRGQTLTGWLQPDKQCANPYSTCN
jgi:hypothetical protein